MTREEKYEVFGKLINRALEIRELSKQYERVVNEANKAGFPICDSCPALDICNKRTEYCSCFIVRWVKNEYTAK